MRLSNGPSGPSGEANINSTILNINSTLLKIAILLVLALFLVPPVSAKGYTLEEATKDITIDPNGVVHIEETISYTFDRNYSYVYRILNVSNEESIQNIEGYCSDNACEFRVEKTPEGYMLIGDLPESTPENMTFFISYDHYGAVKVHRDVSEFQYELWGNEWKKPLGNLKGNITFPVKDGDEIQYWTRPAVYTYESNLEHNVLNLNAKKIPPSQWYKIRVVFPRIESANSSFVQADSAEKLAEILAAENEYQRKGLRLENLYRMTGYSLLFVLAFPLLIYFIYGREIQTDNEEKTSYKKRADDEDEGKTDSEDEKRIDNEDMKDYGREVNYRQRANYRQEVNYRERAGYENGMNSEREAGYEKKINYEEKHRREFPAGSKPAVVNAIMKGRTGFPTMDGFTATFMDLVNRGYISLRDMRPEEMNSLNISYSEPRDFMIELNYGASKTKGNPSGLEDFEKDILDLLEYHASDRKVSWMELKKKLDSGMEFYQFIAAWSKKVKAHSEIDRFFQSTGNKYMNWFSRGILVAAIVYYILISGYFPSDEFPQVSEIHVLTALIGISGFFMIKSSGMLVKTFGRWTPEGNLYYEHWDSVKKYLTDFSALKEHPPESIKTWDSYLVYAASLGVAKQAFQNMSLVVPSEHLKESRLSPISYYYSQPDYESENACSTSCPGGNGGMGIENARRGSSTGSSSWAGGDTE